MKKILYKRFDKPLRTKGSQEWEPTEKKKQFLQAQRQSLKDLIVGFHPTPSKRYHVRVRFYLNSARIGSDLDNMLKEFNDAVFGSNSDRCVYSISAQKFLRPAESTRFWIYELD